MHAFPFLLGSDTRITSLSSTLRTGVCACSEPSLLLTQLVASLPFFPLS